MGNTPIVFDASNIRLHLNGVMIAHITEGQFSSTHEPRKVYSNDTHPHEDEYPGKLTWQITGNSLVQMGTGFSLKDLLLLHKNREQVDIDFVLNEGDDPFKIVGKARLNNINTGGSTGQNGTCSFTLDGNRSYQVEDMDLIEDGPQANLLTFTFPEQTGPATIGTDTIAIEVANGTTVAALVATFTVSSGATVKVGDTAQVSGTTANDFTEPVTYVVTSSDEESTKTYTVTVTVAAE